MVWIHFVFVQKLTEVSNRSGTCQVFKDLLDAKRNNGGQREIMGGQSIRDDKIQGPRVQINSTKLNYNIIAITLNFNYIS